MLTKIGENVLFLCLLFSTRHSACSFYTHPSIKKAFIIKNTHTPQYQRSSLLALSTNPKAIYTSTVDNESLSKKKRVVVIGDGMVGQRFMEDLIKYDPDHKYFQITTFCEEPHAAYNRVRLTSYFTTRNASALSLTGTFDESGKTSWFEQNEVEILLNDKAVSIDTKSKTVSGKGGETIPYDIAVLATGSSPFVPPIPGSHRPGVFVYRTIEDLEHMIAYVADHNVTSAAVIGGGLLGLEAAKPVHDMGVETHIIEFAPILMGRQINEDGHAVLAEKIKVMGIKVHCGARTEAFVGQDGSTDNESHSPVSCLRFSDESKDLPVQMVVISAGIKLRDELARDTGIEIAPRGGVVVDDHMRTSCPGIFAIGEVASYHNFTYGLLAPGYSMAKAAAAGVAFDLNLCSKESQEGPSFVGADLSTRLKLLGCDVASFGDTHPSSDDDDFSEMVWNDPFDGIYRKLFFNKEGTMLRGGILIGDADDYLLLHRIAINAEELPVLPAQLLTPPSTRQGHSPSFMDDKTQVCACNDVTRGKISDCVLKLGVEKATLSEVKARTRAATGCGACEPVVKSIMAEATKKLGGSVSNNLCEHFPYSRPELMALVRSNPDPKSVDSFEKILAKHGRGDGCEICKPTIANILASLYNDLVIDDGLDALQDTNDRSIANMQRAGSYSVIPRVPGGEISPEKLKKLAEVAEKYGLYSKITSQRVGLFGAAKHQLPDIWEELGKVGFESGHAYGKALRNVKSCIGSSWCRFGMQDSTSMAIRLENRYKGVRAPHKFKLAVSSCARECAEARGKDIGLIASENGWNLYVGGNSGANPVHAQLLASDIDEDAVIKCIDRYLMYYIFTADKLERTAVWQKKLPPGKAGGGPIEHLREVIMDDSLGICKELDLRMNYLVDTYRDEWAEVVADPARRAKFKQFVNTGKTQAREDMIEFVDVRGQRRPTDWPADGEPHTMWQAPVNDIFARSEKSWVSVGKVSDFPPNMGSSILYGDTQLAVFNNEKRGEWYCTQNMCPHKQAFVLSQGLMGEEYGIAKVACPLHKKKFSLSDGTELNGDLRILTFPIKIEGNDVLVELPAKYELDAILGTHGLRVLKSECVDIAGADVKVKSREESGAAFDAVIMKGAELGDEIVGAIKREENGEKKENYDSVEK